VRESRLKLPRIKTDAIIEVNSERRSKSITRKETALKPDTRLGVIQKVCYILFIIVFINFFRKLQNLLRNL